VIGRKVVGQVAAVETFNLFKFGPVSDLGFDPFNFKTKYPDQFTMQTKELQNGRLAMLGASGLLLQEYVTGHLF
jgi:light-harvesting complex I chlorophyll a/b binding protein 1